MRSHLSSVICLAVAVLACGCRDSAKDAGKTPHGKAAPAVEVRHPQTESALTTVTLSESASRHLDIQVVAARVASMPNHRAYGGEVVIPEGRSIIISAPMAGTIGMTEQAAFLRPGANVEKGAALLTLHPSIRGQVEILSPSDRIALARARADLEAARVQASGDVESARVRLDGSQIALQRAEKLVKENAGSVRSLDEAKAAHRLAETALEAASARKLVLDETMSYLSGDAKGAALTIASPFSGVVRRLFVAPDEVIAGGTQLCEIASMDPLWVRVSVYVGDLPALSADRPARARRFGARDDESFMLQPVSAPPTSSPMTSAVDLYYSLDNSAVDHQPGERCVVDVPVVGESNAVVIPSIAVLYDIHGDTWVYIARSETVFVRRRVALRRIVDDLAIIADGVQKGERVVTNGSAELFGVEFGTAGH